MNRIQLALNWLEQRAKTLEEVSKDNKQLENDFTKGFGQGIAYTVESLSEEIANLRQIIEGYMIEDVNFDGTEANQEAI